MSETNNRHHRRLPKRAHRACLNCRRKKSRCPGEWPVCSFCNRLGQVCRYDDNLTKKTKMSRSETLADDPDYCALVARLGELEARLQEVSAAQSKNSAPTEAAIELFPISDDIDQLLWQLPESTDMEKSPYSTMPQNTLWTHPSSEAMRESSHVQRAIDSFFLHSHNQPYSFFHEPSFKARLSWGLLPDYLILAVLASAARFLEPSVDKVEMGQVYASRAWNHVLTHMERDEEPSMEIVQAAALLAIFDFTACNNRKAWMKLGTAARFAQYLKLTSEPDSTLPLSCQEERRRTLWSIYLLDMLITCGRARPPVFQEHFCKLNLPSTEHAFRSGIRESPGTVEQVLQDTNVDNDIPAPFARVVIIATLLARCTRYMLQDVSICPEKPPWDRSSDYAAIYSSLLDLESKLGFQRSFSDAILNDCMVDESLDRDSAELVLFSYALYYLTQCLLNHPYLLRRRLEPFSTKIPLNFLPLSSAICQLHAQNLTMLLKDIRSDGCMAENSFYNYCALVSGGINALYCHSGSRALQEESKDGLAICLQFLQDRSRYWHNAKSMLEELQAFCQDAGIFRQLITVDSATVDCSAADSERLFNLVDYNLVSQSRTTTESVESGDSFSTSVNEFHLGDQVDLDFFGSIPITGF